MKKSYDFSKGVKGKFYIPENEIELPIYLDSSKSGIFFKFSQREKNSYFKNRQSNFKKR